MSDDYYIPPYNGQLDLVDGGDSLAIATNPLVANIQLHVNDHRGQGNHIHLFLKENRDGLTSHMTYDPKTAESALHEFTQHSPSHRNALYIISIDMHGDFAEQIMKSGIDFVHIRSFSALYHDLTLKQKPVQDSQPKSNMPPSLQGAAEDGHVPRLAGKRATQDAQRAFSARCDKAGVTLVMDGEIPMKYRFKMPKTKPDYLKIASSDPRGCKGTLKQDFENYTGIPEPLAAPAQAFKDFLEGDDNIFIVYHSQNGTGFGPVMPSFKTPEGAQCDIDKKKSYTPILVLNREASFADQIRGKFISIPHARKHPIITPGTLPDAYTVTAGKNEYLNRPAPADWH